LDEQQSCLVVCACPGWAANSAPIFCHPYGSP
jgi:hypothetical protein